MLDQITPVVLTRDEEVNIGRTLGQLRWAREVVLVDSFSTDATLDIARSFPNVRIVQREFDSHAKQWSFGLQQVTTSWFLALDADHYVTDELGEELASIRPPAGVVGYRGQFKYAVNGRQLRGALYPAHIVLASCRYSRFRQDGHTQRLEVTGEVSDLRSSLVHDDRKPFRVFVTRQSRYMRAEAAKLRAASFASLPLSGRIRKLIFVAPFAVLLHTLFVKGTLLDGWGGVRYTVERVLAEVILASELIRKDGPSRARPGSEPPA